MNVSQIQSGKHHVKIVSEVLKKYPNLAKRENIKLRVVSKNPAAVPPTVQQAVEGDAGGGNKVNNLWFRNFCVFTLNYKSEFFCFSWFRHWYHIFF